MFTILSVLLMHAASARTPELSADPSVATICAARRWRLLGAAIPWSAQISDERPHTLSAGRVTCATLDPGIYPVTLSATFIKSDPIFGIPLGTYEAGQTAMVDARAGEVVVLQAHMEAVWLRNEWDLAWRERDESWLARHWLREAR